MNSVVIFNTNVDVKATGGGGEEEGDIGLNVTYIKDITEKLSDVIFDAYDPGDLRKGRYFGSEGERYAATEILAYEMDEIGLYDPCLDSEDPYLEKLENIDADDYLKGSITNLTEELEPLSYGITIHEQNGNNTINTTLTDFHIEPIWNWRVLFGAAKTIEYWPKIIFPNYEVTREKIKERLERWGLKDYGMNMSMNKNWLTKNVTCNNLKLVPRPTNGDWFTDFINATKENISNNKSIIDFSSLIAYIISQFQEYYNFTFGELNASIAETKFPWFNESWKPQSIGEDEDFIYFGIDNSHNPDVNEPYYLKKYLRNIENEFPEHPLIGLVMGRVASFITFVNIFEKLLWNITMPNCKGIMKYNFNNSTYNMQGMAGEAVNTLFINGSTGNPIEGNLSNYTVSFWINQSWNDTIDSYNVIGQINGTDQSKTVILSCLYDSWYNQGTVDSGIGCAIVMGIAKYMQENKIKPKYNLKFILFSGEEPGCRGAYYYEEKHKDEKVPIIIDLNQLGMDQVPLTLNVYINNQGILYNQGPIKYQIKQNILQTITNFTQYEERLDDGSNLSLNDGTVTGNYWPYLYNWERQWEGTDTLCFLKSYTRNGIGWTNHHRTGENHTKGDVFDHYYPKDVELTTELIYNITRYYALTSHAWFDGTPTRTVWDSPDDNDNQDDSVNVTFSIKTSLPHDRVMVRAILYPKATKWHPFFPLLYRYENRSSYTVTPEGIEDTLTISIPKDAPRGNYKLRLYLYNSSEEVTLKTLENFDVDIKESLIESANSTINNIIDIINTISPTSNLTPKTIPPLVQKLIDNRDDLLEKGINYFFPIIYNLSEILGTAYFVNDSYKPGAFYLSPPNNAPDTPNKPSGSIDVKAGSEYMYSTSTSDDDGDQVFYQWKWRANKLWPGYSKWFGPFNSDQTYEQGHTWYLPQNVQVKVRAKDQWSSPNMYSNWSEPLDVDVSWFGCGAAATSEASMCQSIQNLPYQNNIVVTETGDFEGFNYGLSGSCTYDWDFDDENTTSLQQSTTTHNYGNIGVYNVTLDIENEENESVNCSMLVNVVNLLSGFNVSSIGARPFETIGFSDRSIGKYTITDWTWDFGDGNNSYDQNSSHNYSTGGVYNVTLNVTDDQNNTCSSYLIVYVESTPPRVIDICYNPSYICVNSNVNINTSFFENQSGINTVKVNISYPDGLYGNFTMDMNENCTTDYYYDFSDTNQVGWYFFDVWAVDNADNSNSFIGCSFYVDNKFGYSKEGVFNRSIEDTIRGTNFTMYANGTAENITAYIQTGNGTAPKTRCMIYKASDGSLVGSTEERVYSTNGNPEWVVYNFTGTKPELVNGTEYVISCWSNESVIFYHDNASTNIGCYKNEQYDGTPPDPISWTGYNNDLFSIYCSYTTAPEITDVSASPNNLGFGFNTTISANVNDNLCGIDVVSINITYPDSTSGNFSMSYAGNDIYEYVFSDTWLAGQYDFTIWAVDELRTASSSSGHSFNVSASGTISVCTMLDSYGDNESVNLTDPPGSDPPVIGYELLDDGEVLRIWNRFDSYYFDTDSGIQLTNHYDEYWSTNVLMLGYYNNDNWNLIYRTNELSDFTQDIESDDETYVNATLWKDLSYAGYDFRLAIRYQLGVDDNELTVIPYIKNIGDEDIPYDLGFAWELKDIQVDMTPGGDFIEIDNLWYYLNNSNLDETYTDLSNPAFYIRENITESTSESLYLRWDDSLSYKLQVKSRTGQYNAPVTLGIKIGTLNMDQEKYTSLFWHDASEVTYYFDNYLSGVEDWTTTPGYMVDGSTSYYASTSLNGDVELCINNTCTGTDLGTISKVELQCHGYYLGMNQRDIILRPVFLVGDGDNHNYVTIPAPDWSSWFDITNDNNAPDAWGWDRVRDLDCDVEAGYGGGAFTLKCSKVQIRVTYNVNYPPGITYQYPLNGTTGVSIAPVLILTVSDPESDNMNITWLSNSSGSWQVFGTNSSVGDGTYHQVMSNASVNGQWWYWKVNVSDGSSYNESSVYRFYTGCQSKIVNTGSTSFKGFLLMQIQFYNNSSWVVADDTINDTSPRTMLWQDPGGSPGQHILGLDSVFNDLVNTSNLSSFGNGTYRIYAAFRDPDGNVLVCDDETELVATYEFTITFD